MYMCVCLCFEICVYLTYGCVLIFWYVCVCSCFDICVCAYICVYAHILMYMCVCLYFDIYVCVLIF